MAERIAKRSRKSATTRGRGSNGSAKASAEKDGLSIAERNRAAVTVKLEELTLPILEKYGQAAFDELMARLEITLDEFTQEVSHLFTGMVAQAKDDHDKLRGLLDRDNSVEGDENTRPVMPGDENMSDLERRLETDALQQADQSAEGAEEPDGKES